MANVIASLQQFTEPWLVFLSDDPALRLLQCGMLFAGLAVIFLVFYTTRDILLRTHSFWYMFVSIVMVAALPVVGFLLYLLIRPPRTIKERELEELLMELVFEQRDINRRDPAERKGGIVKKKPKSKRSGKSEEEISL